MTGSATSCWTGFSSRRTALQPDVLVARRGDLLAVQGGKFLEAAPVLAVEVLSPSTQRIDRLSKLSAYEEAGVTSYWLVDPDPENPSLHALNLVDGHYIEVGCPSGDRAWQAQRPFPVTLTPADLVAGLRGRVVHLPGELRELTRGRAARPSVEHSAPISGEVLQQGRLADPAPSPDQRGG